MSKCDYTIHCWADPDCKDINCPGHPKYNPMPAATDRKLPIDFAGGEPFFDRGVLLFVAGFVSAALVIGAALWIKF